MKRRKNAKLVIVKRTLKLLGKLFPTKKLGVGKMGDLSISETYSVSSKRD